MTALVFAVCGLQFDILAGAGDLGEGRTSSGRRLPSPMPTVCVHVAPYQIRIPIRGVWPVSPLVQFKAVGFGIHSSPTSSPPHFLDSATLCFSLSFNVTPSDTQFELCFGGRSDSFTNGMSVNFCCRCWHCRRIVSQLNFRYWSSCSNMT